VSKPITCEQLIAMVERGYHCEFRGDNCLYDKHGAYGADKWVVYGEPLKAHPVCDACHAEALTHQPDPLPEASEPIGQKYNFPVLVRSGE
jgi:hypothetical protein